MTPPRETFESIENDRILSLILGQPREKRDGDKDEDKS